MFDYTIVRTRRRTLGIIISPSEGVVVRAPYRATAEEITHFVQSKSIWIEKHIKGFSDHKSLGIRELKNGDKILFRGKEYPVLITPSGSNSVGFKKEYLEIMTSKPGDQKFLIMMLERWYRINAEHHLRKMFCMLLLRHSARNFQPASFTVRKMKRKWGSCSNRGRITINSELIKLDDSLTEYVILHELCHLIRRDHSMEFYRLLEEMEPDWKEMRKRLRKYFH